MISKTQIDKLGDRLRVGSISEEDLRQLDEYRRSFSSAYAHVVDAVRHELGLESTGRPAKSTTAITDKLLRESIRLSQLQDIAGCRIVLPGIEEQNATVRSLQELFPDVLIVDRRDNPSHGYRAVHLVVKHGGSIVEIQVRTSLQHLWGELSEKMSDLFDPAIKYGGGNKSLLELLSRWSSVIDIEESLEQTFLNRKQRVSGLLSQTRSLTPEERLELVEYQLAVIDQAARQEIRRASIIEAIRAAIENFEQLSTRERRHAFLN